MSKLKDFFSNIAKAYKRNILQYTVAHIVMIITTAILVFGDYKKKKKILEQIVIIGVISTINAFTSESFCKKTWQRVLTGIIGIVIAVIFERLIWLDFDPAITRITIGYCIIVFLIGIIKVIKNSKLEFHEYFTQIFQNLFSTGIIYLIYSIGTRCIENGITPMRYLGIMFIIFEIIAIFLSLYKNRKHLIHVLTASIIIITIVTILPIVNMQTISNISQSNRLKKAWRQGESYSNLTKDQKDTVESAYNYLET